MRFQLLIFSLFVISTIPVSARAEKASPNILVILADDMGYGDVGHLNPESKIPTPNLDRLALQGMTFTDGHSPSSVCTPTRYGLLTGRYAWRSRLKRGVLGGYSPPLIERSRLTIAEMLSRAGYFTAAVGKWHLGMGMPLKSGHTLVETWEGDPGIDFSASLTDSPVDHGFDYYFGVSASLDMAPYVYIRNRRFVTVPDLHQPAVPFPHFVRKGPRSEDFVIDRVLDRLADEAVSIIRDSGRQDRPFFLYLALTAPHKPTQPAERFRGKTELGEYGDFIAQVDGTIGRVLKALDDTGITDQTMVFYSSDNGSYMYRLDAIEDSDHVSDSSRQGYFPENHRANGPLRGTKADIWEAGHRVPFFVRWPGYIKAASRCHQTVSLVDIFATCAELVGISLDSGVAEDSHSILPMLRGEDFMRPVPVVHHSVNGTFAIRQGKWKLVLSNGSGGREKPVGRPFEKPYQLFDLSRDLGETKNLASRFPEIVEQLTASLDKIR